MKKGLIQFYVVLSLMFPLLCVAAPEEKCEKALAELEHAIQNQNEVDALSALDRLTKTFGHRGYYKAALPLFKIWPKVYFMPEAKALRARMLLVLRAIEDYSLADLTQTHSAEAKNYLNKINFLRMLPPVMQGRHFLEHLLQGDFKIHGVPLEQLLLRSSGFRGLSELQVALTGESLGDSLRARYVIRQLHILYVVEFGKKQGSAEAKALLTKLEKSLKAWSESPGNIHSVDEDEWAMAEDLFVAIAEIDEAALLDALENYPQWMLDSPYVIGGAPSDDLHLWTALQYAIFLGLPNAAQALSDRRRFFEDFY